MMISEMINKFVSVVENKVDEFLSRLVELIEDVNDDGNFIEIKTKNGWERVKYE